MINKKLLLLIFGLFMTTQLIFSQVPSYVPSNGLVGYWPFNGNANDASGNGNNGTVVSGSLSNDRLGNANSSYYLNGQTDYITVPSVSSMLPNRLTLSVWVKIPSNYNGNNGIGPIIRARFYGYILWFDSSNGSIIHILHHNSSTTTTTDTPNNINDNQWHQIVGTFDGTNNKLYLDGQLISTDTTASISNLYYVSDGPVVFGRDGNNPSTSTAMYQGWIDDIGIWNRALTQQEITAMYNGVNYSDTCNAVSGSLVNGLVAYYPFCGNSNDQSGNGLNGVVNGATLTTDRFGNSNSAYNFNGVNNLIKVNHSSSFNSFPMSISLWCKGNSQYGALISKYTSCSSDNGWQLHSMEGKASTYSYNFLGGAYLNCDGDSNTIISDNNWYNIVSTYDLSGVKIYVNNVLVLTKPYIGNGTMSAPTNIQDVYIGTEINSINCSSYNTYYQGIIDDIGIWNRVLTQQEITQLYNQNQCVNNITVTDTLIINVGQLSYTNPVTYANNITIYPNPANTQVNISFNNITDLTGGHINIVNSLGQQVATIPITLSGTNTTMPLNTWGGTGLYFVQILNSQGIVVDVKKIILQ
jgi:hypothetical protein